jgi:hypothetical protein
MVLVPLTFFSFFGYRYILILDAYHFSPLSTEIKKIKIRLYLSSPCRHVEGVEV